MKVLILDSGPLINLSMNGLLYIIEKMKEDAKIEIIITKQVYGEVVERPSHIPRFELGALRIKKLVNDNTLQFPDKLGVSEQEINSKTNEILNAVNSSVTADKKQINIISAAETSCLALSNILAVRKIENIIGIDERTTRLLFEKPENLAKIMSKKLHKRIQIEKNNLEKFGTFRFIRSSEIVYVAYKKGLIEINDKNALEALLYATKYKGTSISWEEIEQLKKM